CWPVPPHSRQTAAQRLKTRKLPKRRPATVMESGQLSHARDAGTSAKTFIGKPQCFHLYRGDAGIVDEFLFAQPLDFSLEAGLAHAGKFRHRAYVDVERI